MELKQNCKYALVVPTSMGVRMTPLYGQPVESSHMYFMQATSAETNAASVVSYLGLPVKVLTAFVKDSPIAAFIKRDLLSRGMAYEGPEVDQEGPWGFRHQINIADSGYGARGPRVQNDRAGEVGCFLKKDDFGLDELFSGDGVQILHLSGLIAALSPETGEFCLELVKKAKESNTKISFDLNYRKSFWQGREKELRSVFLKIAKASDILAGNEEDFQLCLGAEGPETGGGASLNEVTSFKKMIEKVKDKYPDISVFATTLREVKSANNHMWGAIMCKEDEWFEVAQREIQVLDRIGGGDCFVGGMLYAILKGWDTEKWIQFAWANGALATTMMEDHTKPMSENQVWDVWKGNARVQR